MSDSHHHDDLETVQCAVITVSDTRTEDTDESGKRIRELLEQAGHEITSYTIVPDEPHQLKMYLQRLGETGRYLVVLVSGGTGLAPRDETIEAVASLFDRRIDGFGELFRQLSFKKIGPKAMLSRAAAGLHKRMVIFSMPGSTPAVELAVEELILPTMSHLMGLVKRPAD